MNKIVSEKEYIKKMVDKGFTIQGYIKKRFSSYLESYSYEMEWNGYKCLVCNRGHGNTYIFEALYDEKKHDRQHYYWCRVRRNRT